MTHGIRIAAFVFARFAVRGSVTIHWLHSAYRTKSLDGGDCEFKWLLQITT